MVTSFNFNSGLILSHFNRFLNFQPLFIFLLVLILVWWFGKLQVINDSRNDDGWDSTNLWNWNCVWKKPSSLLSKILSCVYNSDHKCDDMIFVFNSYDLRVYFKRRNWSTRPHIIYVFKHRFYFWKAFPLRLCLSCCLRQRGNPLNRRRWKYFVTISLLTNWIWWRF